MSKEDGGKQEVLHRGDTVGTYHNVLHRKFRKGKRILKQEDRKDCSLCAGRVVMVMPCECGLCAVESCPNISNHDNISKAHRSFQSKNTTGHVWWTESKSSF